MLGTILIISFIVFFLISLLLKFSRYENKYVTKDKEDFEIVITSLNEDESLVKETILTWLPTKRKIFLLRDGTITENFRNFLDDNGIYLVQRNNKNGGKAGALNNYIKNYNSSPWFFLVDVDEKLVNKNNLLRAFNIDGDIIITKKEFLASNFLGHLMNLTNSIFSTVQKFSSKKGKALFNGSCAFISSSLARSLEFRNFKIEDIEFSLRAIKSGYKLVFEDVSVAVGKQPSFYSFLMQHSRYAYGNGEILRHHIKNILEDPEIFMILLFLPAFSLFQLILIFYSIFFFDYFPIFVEFILSYVSFFLYLNTLNPLTYLGVFLINMLILPFFRTYYFILGLLNKNKTFSTTL